MASANVFGEPVIEKTPLESAIKARDHQSEISRDAVVNYVINNSEKEKWKTAVATVCMFYNATGQPLVFYEQNSLHGHVDDENYPVTVENGQFGGFWHVADSSSGSVGFVVYRGKYTGMETFCKLLLAWKTPGGENSKNIAYCGIFDDNVSIDPDDIYKKMEDKNSSSCTVRKMGMYANAITVDGKTTPLYDAMLTIDETIATKNPEGVEASST